MISFGSAFRYALFPRVVPRVFEVIPDTKFFAQLMALVFFNIGLLPRGNQLLLPHVQGTYGVRTVLSEAAAHLGRGWRYADQYILYVAFILGIVIFSLQFAVLFFGILMHAASAAIPFLGMFTTSNPTDDIALMMLDKVFQIPGFFKSRFDPVAPANIDDFARGMQVLFRFYSEGMMAIGGLILAYYFFALLAETAQTGVPFGKRFPSVYGPLRLVLAVLLLLPLAYGYNSGQYLTLLMAKWGSGFATNSWLTFNSVMFDYGGVSNPAGLPDFANSGTFEIYGDPKLQSVSSLVNYFYIAQTCRAAYQIAYGGKINDIRPYVIKYASATNPSDSLAIGPGTNFTTVEGFLGGADVVIVFGSKDNKYKKYPGLVKPYCGSLGLTLASKDVTRVKDIYDSQFTFTRNLWYNAAIENYGTNMAYILRFWDRMPSGFMFSPGPYGWGASLGVADAGPAGATFYTDLRVDQQAQYEADIYFAVGNIMMNGIPEMDMSADVLARGWGGAGIWYNKVAEFNGAMVDATYSIPKPVSYPMVMEYVATVKKSLESSTNPRYRFSPMTSNGKGVSIEKYAQGYDLDNPAVDIEIANLLSDIFETVGDDEITERPRPAPVANDPVKNMFMTIFSESGLLDVRNNDGVFPLSKLTMLGNSIINKTILSIGAGGIVSGFGGLLSGAGAADLGAAFEQGGGVLLGFASTGLIIGFILAYLIPFFPFIYFYFAVGRWVKSIFEAMVAVPIWALAHLRMDGEGVGNAASKGYFLLLEIMLRPVFTVFGLMAAITTFSALVVVLDSIFDVVVWNVAGFDMSNLSPSDPQYNVDVVQSFRDSIDMFFYTIIYVIIIYMMAMSSFKLIDLIPNKLLRFLQPVPTFHDGASDPAENLVRNTAFAGHHFTGSLAEGIGDFSKGIGKTAGKVIDKGMADKMGGPGA